jgi:hypothetical protein
MFILFVSFVSVKDRWCDVGPLPPNLDHHLVADLLIDGLGKTRGKHDALPIGISLSGRIGLQIRIYGISGGIKSSHDRLAGPKL